MNPDSVSAQVPDIADGVRYKKNVRAWIIEELSVGEGGTHRASDFMSPDIQERGASPSNRQVLGSILTADELNCEFWVCGKLNQSLRALVKPSVTVVVIALSYDGR
ncbi:hypothetical protein EVAR_94296_1 [Eumeta japonica]|uniref:Uncharacterized protein n=1 Tax=Eumeta variegata TaxID=151549 RepID=A0A4C1UG92_EUMVA|nr:hypothetical protein EVAR_94296_1 [Eumeta japonica]